MADATALTTVTNFKEYMGITGIGDDTLIGNLISRATNAIQIFCHRDFLVTTYREFHDGDGQFELNLHNFPVLNVNMLGVGKQDAFMIKNTSADAYNAYVSISATEMHLVVQGGTNDDDSSLTLATYTTLTALFTAITDLAKGWEVISTDALAFWSAIELLPTGKGLQCLDNYASPQLPDEPEADFMTDTAAGILKYCGRFNKGFENIVVRYSAGYSVIPGDLEQICIDLVKSYYDKKDLNASVKGEKIGDYSYTNISPTDSTAGNTSAGIPSDISVRLLQWRTLA